ncbi:MAG: autotransporter-associated beta strand repeat-containing protein, partial [Pirellulales bacterium]|nr:autotransporter-associated beta strand repeat-containing protein [Pirellulales bacterium]
MSVVDSNNAATMSERETTNSADSHRELRWCSALRLRSKGSWHFAISSGEISMLRFMCFTGFVLLVLGAITVPGWADVVYWDGADTLFGGLDHRFTNPLNWSTDVFPAATDSAYIEDGDTALIDETPPNEVMDLGLAITQDTSGYVNMTVGTVTITGDLRVGGGANTTAGFDMNGGTVNVGDEFLIGRANTAKGTLNLVDGNINYNYRSMFAYDANSVAVVHQSGGSLLNNPEATNRSWSRWAYGVNSYLYYDLNGGTFQAEGLLMSTASDTNGENNSVAIINQTGGTLTIDGSTVGSATGPSIRLSNGSGAISAYNLTNSACVVQNYAMSIAGSGNFTPTAQVNVNSGGQLTLQDQTNGYLRIAYTHATGGPSLGVLNLNTGGTVTAAWIQSGDGTTATTAGNAHFNFHGGTLVANSEQADFLRQMDAYVYSEGAKIDTDGHDVTINRALLAPTGSGVQSIALSDGGSGYQGAPAVKITGGTGSGASAIAVVSGGVVTGITMTNPGTGYDPGDTLVVTLHGGGTATPATLGAATLAANSASGGLEKLGLGTLTLAGTNSYTGLTDVQAGTLRVTSSVAGSVDVADGAMWSANGTVGGNLDLSDGG